MADTERENSFGFVDKRRNPKGQDSGNVNGAPTATATAGGAQYGSVASLRAYLASRNATYYTPTRLNLMTKNDMVYASRLEQDAAGI